MKVGKSAIEFAINQLIIFYPEFARHSQYVDADMLVDNWYNLFNSIKYDYEYAEQDFKQAVKNLITHTRVTPSCSDVIDEMRNIHGDREKEIAKKEYLECLEKENGNI